MTIVEPSRMSPTASRTPRTFEAAFTAVMMALRIGADMRPAMRSLSSRSARADASIAIAV